MPIQIAGRQLTRTAARAIPIALVLLLTHAAGRADDWKQFRGPRGAATSEQQGLPVEWSAEENVAWRTRMPGFGSSSPIVLGDRVFLTCYSGYGLDRANPGNRDDLKRHLLCIDRGDGSIIWDRAVPAIQPESNYTDVITGHGYATHTPVTDGERVYAFFGRSGVYCFDLEGNQLWHEEVGHRTHYWGAGASPIVHGNLLIVNAAIERYSVLGLDKKTGEEVWRAKNMTSSWSTPLVVDLPDGTQELVVSARRSLIGLDPRTGEELWTLETDPSYSAPSPVARRDVVYAVDGQVLLAVRAGGRGEVNALWKVNGLGSGITSPLLYGDYVFMVNDRGIAGCVDAKTGDLVKRQRIPGGRLYASAVAADGKLYAVTRNNGTYVLSADGELKQLAHNDLGDDSIFNATPALHRGQLLIRSDRYLYCLGGAK